MTRLPHPGPTSGATPPDSSPSRRPEPTGRAGGRRLPLAALLALAATGLLTMLTEAVPAGLLPQIGTGLGVSTGHAGQTVTVYAVGSMVAALPLTALTRSWPRRRLLLTTTLAVTVVNLLTAFSSSYGLTLAARLGGGLAAGVQWAMIAGYAMRLVQPSQQGRALAVSMAGVPLGLALGVPAGTALGELLGWRSTFLTMAVLGVLAGVAVRTLVPAVPGTAPRDRAGTAQRAGAAHPGRSPLRLVLLRPGLPVILAVALTFEVGHMNLYTYVTPLLARADLAQHVGLLLLVFGLAALVGLWVVGLLIDRRLRALLLGVLTLFAACMLALATWGQLGAVVVAAVAGWGLALGGAPTLLQAAGARVAGRDVDVAQAALVTVLNAGMAAGAGLGGLMLGLGPQVLARVSLTVFVVALLLTALGRRHAFPPDLPTTAGADVGPPAPRSRT